MVVDIHVAGTLGTMILAKFNEFYMAMILHWRGGVRNVVEVGTLMMVMVICSMNLRPGI